MLRKYNRSKVLIFLAVLQFAALITFYFINMDSFVFYNVFAVSIGGFLGGSTVHLILSIGFFETSTRFIDIFAITAIIKGITHSNLPTGNIEIFSMIYLISMLIGMNLTGMFVKFS